MAWHCTVPKVASTTVGSGESDPRLPECTAVPQHGVRGCGCLRSVLMLKIKRGLAPYPTVEHQDQMSTTELFGWSAAETLLSVRTADIENSTKVELLACKLQPAMRIALLGAASRRLVSRKSTTLGLKQEINHHLCHAKMYVPMDAVIFGYFMFPLMDSESKMAQKGCSAFRKTHTVAYQG